MMSPVTGKSVAALLFAVLFSAQMGHADAADVAWSKQPGWNTLFRQTYDNDQNTALPFNTYDKILSYGEQDDPNFSRLGSLDEFKSGDGKFTLRFFDGVNQNIWRQSSNFVLGETDVDNRTAAGYEEVFHPRKNRGACYWAGLVPDTCNWQDGEPSPCGKGPWFDGTAGEHWWWAVGLTKKWSDNEIPGVCGKSTHIVEVSAHYFDGYCEPGEFVAASGAWCVPCPVNTYTNDTQVTASSCTACPELTYAWTGSSECVPVAPTGEWITIFKQSPSGSQDTFRFRGTTLWFGDSEADPNFSRLSDLETFRDSRDNKFTLKYSDGTNTQIWRQSLNFVTTGNADPGVPADGYEAVTVSSDGCNWGGLQQAADQAWFDGSSGAGSWWPVGIKDTTAGLYGGCQHGTASEVKLEVYVFSGFCGVGERVDPTGPNCLPCEANTYNDNPKFPGNYCPPCPDSLFAVEGQSECGVPIAISDGWNLLFRQSYNPTDTRSDNDELVFSTHDDVLFFGEKEDPNYSRLAYLENLRDMDNKFHFKYTDGTRQMVWKQTSNFVTTDVLTTEVQGLEDIEGPDNRVDRCDWGGLQQSTSSSLAWFDGSNGFRWWFAIGAKSGWPQNDNNGLIPGVCAFAAEQVELWAYIFPGFCQPGEYVVSDSLTCAKCPQNTYTDAAEVTDTECTPCAGGTFSVPGSSECKAYGVKAGWTTIFRHTRGAKEDFLFSSLEEALWLNADAPESENFSLLKLLDGPAFFQNGRYRFRLLTDGGSDRIWRQTSNPIATEDAVAGYKEETHPAAGGTDVDCSWNGLALSSGSNSYLDGSIGSSSWWFAVGARTDYNGGHIPAECRKRDATKVELQAWLFDGTCGAGEYVNEGLFCSPCPLNTFTTGTEHTLTECTPCEYGQVAAGGAGVCLDLIVEDGWTLLFRQTHPFLFTNYQEALWLNANMTASENYSILATLELLRERGRFKFKYINVDRDNAANNKEIIWTQSSNFVEALPGDTPTGVAVQTAPPTGGRWQGLANSESSRTWWDGSNGSSWWWAVGVKSEHSSGFAGIWPSYTQRVEVWAFRAYDPVKCDPGEIIDEDGNCAACEQNTVSSGGLQFECTACPAGEFAPPGQSSCAPCAPGYKWDLATAACAYCPMNTFALGDTMSCEPCPPGNYSATAASECLAPIPCDASYVDVCHYLSWCNDATCVCPVGLIGDGEGEDGCKSTGWTMRFSMKYLNDPGLRLSDGTLAFWDSHLRDQFVELLGLGSTAPPNFETSMHHEVSMVEVDPTMDPVGLITVNALFATQAAALAAADTLRTNLGLNSTRRSGTTVTFSGIPLTEDNVIGPNVYTWTAGTTSDALQIEATGMNVDSVSFDTACEETGCWVIDVTFTLGRNAFNVLYMPHAVGDDEAATDFDYTDDMLQDWSAPRYNYQKSPSSTYVASNFPCGSADYVPDSTAYPPLKVTACCLPEFVDMYRPLQAFATDVKATWGISQSDCELSTTTIPIFDRPNWADDDNHARLLALPTNYVNGAFKGMDHCYVEFKEIVDPYIRQYKAAIKCDEKELRTKAGMLRGTVGVEHTVDTFVGIANYKPTGITFLDSAAMQVNIHLEKTNFFSVSTHGVNEYTFLEYVNMRLVAVYTEDTDLSETASTSDDARTTRTDFTGAAHYVQVTFTLGRQYVPNENLGLIPLDSVRVGQGTFFDSSDMTFHPCANYEELDGYAAFPEKDTFDERFPNAAASPPRQMCAPNAQMCVSPASVPDHFVSFNIPLGIDWLPTVLADDQQETLSNNVFVHLVVNAKDADAITLPTSPNDGEDPQQMKTTLSASIPVVRGGVNIFCDQIVAKTDLQDVVDADLIFGTASNEAELSRLRIFKDIASSNLDRTAASVFETDSIEAGFMTLVVKGEESYFGLGGTQGYGIQLEDVITVHIMEPGTTKFDFVKSKLEEAGDDNYADATSLNYGGYKLNGAFRFEIDRSQNRAHLHPTDELLAECPFNPARPSASVAFPATCVVRRDVQKQGFPVRTGADSATAQEVLADGTADRSTNGQFVQTVLGANNYAMQLGKDFSQVLAATYGLNDRYLRAWFINPGYEWTPTQTGGQSIFTVSQRIFMFALINLDENLVRRRALSSTRMLLQSVSGSGAGMTSTELQFETSPTKLMQQAFGVSENNVAIYDVEVQLTADEACMDDAELQRKLTASFDDALTGLTSPLETVQVLSLAVSNRPSDCSRRKALNRKLLASFSEALAQTKMMLVFKASSESLQFNTAKFTAMPGINDVKGDQVPAGVVEVLDTEGPPIGDGADSKSGSSSNNSGLIAGVAGGVGGAVFLLGGAMIYLKSRNRATEQVETVQALDVNDLKAQLAEEA